MVQEAPVVVQVEIMSVGEPRRSGKVESCSVRGTVVRAFRGRRAVGDAISIPVVCGMPDSMPGPTLITSPEALATHPILEAHLTSGGIVGHGAGLVLLDAPTDEIAYIPRS